jgi:probable F420-dependent oxidoreductase
MDFGVIFTNVGRFAQPDGARAIGQAAEAAGFESLWTVEHVVVPVGYQSEYPYDASGRMPGGEDSEIPDPLIWLSFVAAHTSTIKLGTGILILPQRNPLIVAKQIATLDRLSAGRVLLGIGVGWLEEEFDALGVPFAARGKRTDEHVAILRALWDEGPTAFDGEFTSFGELWSRPRPDQDRLPIIIGGHSEAAARRAGRIGDGFFPGRGREDELRALITVMRQAAEDAGRDPDAIEVTTGTASIFGPDPAGAAEELAAIGVTRLVIPPLSFDPDAVADALAQFGENVIAKVNP